MSTFGLDFRSVGALRIFSPFFFCLSASVTWLHRGHDPLSLIAPCDARLRAPLFGPSFFSHWVVLFASLRASLRVLDSFIFSTGFFRWHEASPPLDWPGPRFQAPGRRVFFFSPLIPFFPLFFSCVIFSCSEEVGGCVPCPPPPKLIPIPPPHCSPWGGLTDVVFFGFALRWFGWMRTLIECRGDTKFLLPLTDGETWAVFLLGRLFLCRFDVIGSSFPADFFLFFFLCLFSPEAPLWSPLPTPFHRSREADFKFCHGRS